MTLLFSYVRHTVIIGIVYLVYNYMWRTSVGSSDTGTVNYTGNTSARQSRGPAAMLPAPGTRGSKRKAEKSDGAETSSAARKKPPAAERERARKDVVKFVRQLHNDGRAWFRRQGFQPVRTEAAGDCWLIAIMAGREIPRNCVVDVGNKRETLCTARRKDVVDLFTTLGSGDSSAEFQLAVASVCGVDFDVEELRRGNPRSDAVLGVLAEARDRLAIWLKPLYFGNGQSLMHMGLGRVLGRNILTICEADRGQLGDGTRALTLPPVQHCLHLYCSCCLVSFSHPGLVLLLACALGSSIRGALLVLEGEATYHARQLLQLPSLWHAHGVRREHHARLPGAHRPDGRRRAI